MSRGEFVRTEQVAPVSGAQVIYRQDVPWQPAPQIIADANGVYLTGQHIAASREQINRLMACMEAAWSDHVVLKMTVPAYAHGNRASENAGSSA